jgi:DNA-binding IclR family transcriptional regulator
MTRHRRAARPRGPADDEEHRAEIVRLVKGAPWVGITALAERTGLEVGDTRRIVDDLLADGTLRREGDRLIVVEPAASEADRPIP